MGARGPRSLRGTSFPIPRSGSVWGCQGPTLTGICSTSNACMRGPSAGPGVVVGSVYERHSGRSSTFRPWPRASPSPGPTPRHHACRSVCITFWLVSPGCQWQTPCHVLHVRVLRGEGCSGPHCAAGHTPGLSCLLAALCRPWPPTRGSPRTMCSSPVGGLPLSVSCVSQQGSNDPAQGPTALPICTQSRGRWVPCGAHLTQPGSSRTGCAQRQAWACLPESGHCSRAL